MTIGGNPPGIQRKSYRKPWAELYIKLKLFLVRQKFDLNRVSQYKMEAKQTGAFDFGCKMVPN